MTTDPQRRVGQRAATWGYILIAVVALIALAFSLWYVYTTAERLASQWEITAPDFSDTPVVSDDPVQLPQPQFQSSNDEIDIISEPGESLSPWSGTERVTVLFLGIDQRCDEDGPTRTDSMMLASVDPVAQSATILSLPRDLWVDIPGFGLDRINQAHYLGEVYEYPGGGGPALAVETVSANLGIPVDYYATVNFDAFVEVVDLIGGIDIEVPERIDDPDYPDSCYGYDPFLIEAGRHHLDGADALKYARTRATFGGDVDRAARQQQVVLAVRDQILQPGMVTQLMGQAPNLWETMQQNARTNLTLNEVLQLALLLQELPRENVRTAVIDYSYVYDQKRPDGQQVLVPIRENIRALRDELFAPPARPTPDLANLPEEMLRERARVALYNGTPVFGLAAETEAYLQQYDVDVTEIGNADSSVYPTSQIVDYGSHPYTTQLLTQILSVPPLNVTDGGSPDGDFDVLVILGNDWVIPDQ